MSHVKILLILAWNFLVVPGHAQFVETFSDGDFQTAPAWSGDQTKFVVANSMLKLLAPAVAGTAQLTTASQAIHEASWEFVIRMDFNPSSTNYAKVYLVSDQPDLQQALNGYFIKVGNTSREVSLYRQTGNSEVEIIDGLDDRVNQSIVNVRIRVLRSGAGVWELFSDSGLSGSFALEGQTTDITHTRSEWFGLQCIYTATRSDKFWFDEFVVTGSITPDLIPPVVVKVEATEPSRMEIRFSEPVIGQGVVVVEGVGVPGSVQPVDSGMGIVCTMLKPFKNGVTYLLQVSGFSDGAGNEMMPMSGTVRYFKPGVPKPKCILITEVFADPTPQIGLPNVEYIELFHPGDEPFDLKGWKLTDGSSTGVFPSIIFLPGEYMVVTSTSGATFFSKAVPLTNFPSLNNAGDRLVISDQSGQPIDSVIYTVAWYRDEDKASGGWSLELIDPANPCGEADNWTASEDSRGGTPGEPNSVLASKPDLTAPKVVSVRPMDSMRVVVTFDEILQGPPLSEASIELRPIIPVLSLNLNPSRKQVVISLGNELHGRVSYELSMGGVRDCNGNLMDPVKIMFGLPEPADSLDVVLSEVLFNPRSGGVDFVEVYNGSEKYIDLGGWLVANQNSEEVLASTLLAPKTWLAVSPDPSVVMSQYPTQVSGIFARNKLPSFPDNEGTVRLFNERLMLMDQLDYEESWHSALLKSAEGVSLERIDVKSPTQDKENWTSASVTVGFATPGLPNSQRRDHPGSESQFYIHPEIFSPGSSAAGFVQIMYHMEKPGSVATLRIYDWQGTQVKELANNFILGTEGFFRWDGDRENGIRAHPGYYVLLADFFTPDGTTETIRKRIVIAPR